MRSLKELLCQSPKYHPTIDQSPSWSIWDKKSKRKNVRETSSRTHIYVFGKVIASTMCMIRIVLRNLFTLTPLNLPFNPFSKDIMQQFWLMVRLELAKHTQWKVSNIMVVILNAVLFLDAWKKFSSSSKCKQTIR